MVPVSAINMVIFGKKKEKEFCDFAISPF